MLSSLIVPNPLICFLPVFILSIQSSPFVFHPFYPYPTLFRCLFCRILSHLILSSTILLLPVSSFLTLMPFSPFPYFILSHLPKLLRFSSRYLLFYPFFSSSTRSNPTLSYNTWFNLRLPNQLLLILSLLILSYLILSYLIIS